jgi:hypothetical protein
VGDPRSATTGVFASGPICLSSDFTRVLHVPRATRFSASIECWKCDLLENELYSRSDRNGDHCSE